MSFIEEIDLFGKDVNFKHKNNQKYKNSFGGILTLFYVCITLLIFIYFFINYIQRKNFSIIYQPQKYEISREINLTKFNYSINFNMVLSNETEYTNSIDEILNYFNLMIYNFRTYKFLNFTKCSESNFVNHRNNRFNDCLAAEFTQNEVLYENGIGFGIMFNNETKFIEKYENFSLVVYIYMNDISFSLENNTNPLQKLPRKLMKVMSYETIIKRLLQAHFVYFGTTIVTTDYSWFFESNEQIIENINIFNIGENQGGDVINNLDFIYELKIHASNEGHSYKKSFQKFSEFLANASSVSNLIFLFFSILTITHKNISVEIEALNNIFQYDSIKNTNQTVIKIELKNEENKNCTTDNVNGISQISKGPSIRKIYNLRKIQKRSNNIIIGKVPKFNHCQIVSMTLCFCTKRMKSRVYLEYLKGSSIINYYLDFENFLLKMIEIDFLKYLLLNKDQLSLFKFVKLDYLSILPKSEFISVINNLKDNSLVGNEKQKEENLINNQSLLKIIHKQNHTEIDKKILNSIDSIDIHIDNLVS